MPRNKNETHKKIEEVAKAEFLAKGFMGASMRDIGSKVGITQAALYRHFASKEAMFEALVLPLVNSIARDSEACLNASYQSFDETKGSESMLKNNVCEFVKRLMVEYPLELKLIVSSSTGTKYEGYIDELIKKEAKDTLDAFSYLRKNGLKIREISNDEITVLISAYFKAAIEPISKNWPLEKSLKCLDLIEEFFNPAWKCLMGFKEED